MTTIATPRWKVKLFFMGQWVPLPGSWATRDDAEWDIARWKQQVGLYTDPFSYYEMVEVEEFEH